MSSSLACFSALPKRTRLALAACCGFFVLRGAADIWAGWYLGAPSNYLIGLAMLFPVLLYSTIPEYFPATAAVIGLIRFVASLLAWAFLTLGNTGMDLYQPRNPELIWAAVGLARAILPFIVGVYCIAAHEHLKALGGSQNANAEKDEKLTH